MRMAKVVHVTSVHPALDNRILFKECRSLRQAGHEVVLVAPHARDEVVDGVRIRAFPRAAGRLARMTRGVRDALALCAEEAGDLYHFHDPELMPGMMRFARAGRPVIFDMHENVVADIRSKAWIPGVLRAVVARAVALGMRTWLRDMRVVFAEHAYAGDYPWIDGGVTVLNLPRLDELLRVGAVRAPGFRVAYVGSITAQRGSLLTLEALRRLRDQGVDVGLDCVGLATEEHEAELRAFASRHGLRGVVVHGYRTPDRAYDIAARCHAGLAVLDDDENLRQSYPTKLFEYMALGLPVIVSDFPLWRGVVDDAGCGLCIPPSDPDALASAIALLADDPVNAARMGARGRDAASARFRWETEEAKLLALYAELIGEPDVRGSDRIGEPVTRGSGATDVPETARRTGQFACTAPASGAAPSK